MNFLPGIETETRLRYAAIRSGFPAATLVVVLHIGTEQTAVASGSNREPDAVMVLEIGSHKTSTDYFRHTPPAPLELENAIAKIEDAVARVRPMIAENSTLFTTDTAIGEIAHISGVSAQPVLTLPLEAVESMFERMAAISLGRPAAQDTIPASPTFAATVLILREFMHHLNFSSITVQA